MKTKRRFMALCILTICMMPFLATRALANNLPCLSINATNYLPGETMEINVFHTEGLSGKKYLEILWLDTGNIICRTEFGQGRLTMSAPKKAGSYKIRLVLENEEQEKKFTVTKDSENVGVLRGEVSKNSVGDILGVFLYWDGNKSQDGTQVFNSVVVDTTEFIPSEYHKNNNTGVIELQVGNPYMTVSIPDKDDRSVLIDSKNVNIVPVLQQGRVMLPIRAVVEAMGGTVAWQGDSRSVMIAFSEQTVEIPIGRKTILVNGESRSFDVPAEVADGRTRVPIRHLESLGCEVEWRRETRGVTIRFHVDSK